MSSYVLPYFEASRWFKNKKGNVVHEIVKCDCNLKVFPTKIKRPRVVITGLRREWERKSWTFSCYIERPPKSTVGHGTVVRTVDSGDHFLCQLRKPPSFDWSRTSAYHWRRDGLFGSGRRSLNRLVMVESPEGRVPYYSLVGVETTNRTQIAVRLKDP